MTDARAQALQAVQVILEPLREYTVEKILGVGAMGYVVQVNHRLMGLRAIKLVHPNLLLSQTIRRRFDTEALVMSRLDHPNIVRVYDMGTAGNSYPYILMELLQGGTLEEHLDTSGVMPPRQALGMTIAILRGLQAAHDEGVVHRDIKPENILFTNDGIPKITDFGIARLEEGTRSLTQEGATMGTYAYMAPEQLHGEIGRIDHRCDIHAVGVMFYFVLTLGNLGQIEFYRQMEEHPERLDPIDDERLRVVILKATAKEPEDRFLTAAAMADELQLYLKQGVAEDPEDTPALGSAPSINEAPDDVGPLDEGTSHAGSTMVPNPTHAQAGHAASVSGDGTGSSHIGVSWVPAPVDLGAVHGNGSDFGLDGDVPMLGTIQPDRPEEEEDKHKAELAAIRTASKRRLFQIIVVALLLVCLAGASLWLAIRDENVAVVESDPTPIEVAPVVETVSDASIDLSTSEPEATPTPVVESTRVESAPSPTVAPQAKVKATVTPEQVVAVVEQAQVRLILNHDTTAMVTLVGDERTFTLRSGNNVLPQGTYQVRVQMPGRDGPQTGTLLVTPGLTTLTCDGRFKMCTGLK